MDTRRKLLIAAGVIIVLSAIIGFSIRARRGVVHAVEVGRVHTRAELISKVSATGEIKPKEFVELQSEIAGVIIQVSVQEGDAVQQGELLLRIDPVQTESETRAQKALLDASLAESRNSKAQILVQRSTLDRDSAAQRVAEADLIRARQNLELVQANFERQQELFENDLISRERYESAKNDRVSAESAVAVAEARLEQAHTQLEVSRVSLEQAENSYAASMSRVQQQRASLERSQDSLSKTAIRSPLTGVITQLNVEVGERAVPGTLNNPAATLMVIADLSVIEAEVEVDETDIVDVRLGQKAEVTVDALPQQPLQGTVTEIGTSAIQKSGQTEEAKDFKVVIQLDGPPGVLRPGLSCTADITTAHRSEVVTVPIQALTLRELPVDKTGQIRRPDESAGESNDPDLVKKEFEGVFRVRNGTVEFVPLKTGIIGETEIEVLSGVEPEAEIVTGSYQTLRTISDGDAVRISRRDET